MAPSTEKRRRESKLRADCRKKLRSIGVYIHSPVPFGFGRSGVDDYLCINGRFVAVEYKDGDEEPTGRQEDELMKVRRAGGKTVVAHSWEDLWKGLGYALDPAS